MPLVNPLSAFRSSAPSHATNSCAAAAAAARYTLYGLISGSECWAGLGTAAAVTTGLQYGTDCSIPCPYQPYGEQQPCGGASDMLLFSQTLGDYNVARGRPARASSPTLVGGGTVEFKEGYGLGPLTDGAPMQGGTVTNQQCVTTTAQVRRYLYTCTCLSPELSLRDRALVQVWV